MLGWFFASFVKVCRIIWNCCGLYMLNMESLGALSNVMISSHDWYVLFHASWGYQTHRNCLSCSQLLTCRWSVADSTWNCQLVLTYGQIFTPIYNQSFDIFWCTWLCGIYIWTYLYWMKCYGRLFEPTFKLVLPVADSTCINYYMYLKG